MPSTNMVIRWQLALRFFAEIEEIDAEIAGN